VDVVLLLSLSQISPSLHVEACSLKHEPMPCDPQDLMPTTVEISIRFIAFEILISLSYCLNVVLCLGVMATNPVQSQAREIYLEKRRANTTEHIRRCRARQAENNQSQSTSEICEEATFMPTRSFDSTGQ
jgi:hypothetical protein